MTKPTEPGMYWVKRSYGADEWLPAVLSNLGTVMVIGDSDFDNGEHIREWGPPLPRPGTDGFEAAKTDGKLEALGAIEHRIKSWMRLHQMSIEALEEKRKKIQTKDKDAKPSDQDKKLYWMENGAHTTLDGLLRHIQKQDIAEALGEKTR